MQRAPEYHLPVLGPETSELLVTDPDGFYVDATVGGGGHAEWIARRLGRNGCLLGMDRDPDALTATTARFRNLGLVIKTRLSPFRDLGKVVAETGETAVDGILFDLGVSSHQIDDAERGFSYSQDGPLDMRMGPDADRTAADVVNGYSEQDLARIFRDYGEERRSAAIARAICRQRDDSPYRRTLELRQTVARQSPGPHLQKRLARIFQAIRIEVNGELAQLEPALNQAVELLRPGGRLAVLTYHSLEDRVVKAVYRLGERGCICPPSFPVCRCGRVPTLKRISPKGARAEEAEVSLNPRARSATLRVAERLPAAGRT